MSLSIQPNFDLKSESEVKEKKDKKHDTLKEDIAGSGHKVSDLLQSEHVQGVQERKEKNKKEEKEVETKKRSDKETSVSLASGEIKSKDLLDEFAQRMVKREQSKQSEQMEKKLKQQYSEQINDIVKDQTQSKFKDSVQLSKFAVVQQEEFHKKEKKTEESAVQNLDAGQGVKPQFQAAQSQAANTLQETKQKQERQQETITQENPIKLERGMKDFLSAFSEALVTQNPKKKQDTDRLRQSLQSMGVSTKKILTMESQAQKMVATDLKRMMRQSLLKVGFTYDSKKLSAELLSNYQNYKELVATSEKLGIFGAGTKDETAFRDEIKSEVKDFIRMELDRTVIETKLKSNDVKELVKAFDKLNNVAGFANFDPGSYMRFFNKKVNDLGLVPFVNPNPPAGQMDTETSGGGKGGQQSKNEDQNPAPVSLENQLKALHIKKYLVSGPIDVIRHALKIRQVEKSLKEQGKAEVVERIQKETPSTAKLKLSFMLRETFEERATLFELKGPKHNLVTKKLKSILKGFKQLGEEIPRTALKDIMDQSNKAIFSIVKEDYLKLKVHYEINPKNTALKQRHDSMVKLLARLRDESGISEELEPKLMKDMDFLTDVNIIEAA